MTESERLSQGSHKELQ